jgi:hypothetical protein
MTITYRIEPDNERVEVVLTDTIGVVALIKMIRDVLDHPEFDPLYDVIADCGAARIGRVSFGLAEAMIAISAGNDSRRLAIVAPKGDGVEHAHRFVKLRDDPRRARVFSDRQHAEAWLAEPVIDGICAVPG